MQRKEAGWVRGRIRWWKSSGGRWRGACAKGGCTSEAEEKKGMGIRMFRRRAVKISLRDISSPRSNSNDRPPFWFSALSSSLLLSFYWATSRRTVCWDISIFVPTPSEMHLASPNGIRSIHLYTACVPLAARVGVRSWCRICIILRVMSGNKRL